VPLDATANSLLETRDLTKQYVRKKFLSKPQVSIAVDNVDFHIGEASVTALVGASGAGKSTLARCLTGIETPSHGRVLYRGKDISSLDKTLSLAYRRKVQLVFQEAAVTLNPRFTGVSAVAEPLAIAGLGNPASRAEQALHWIEEVGLAPEAASRPALEFSGGQRQRLAIARALTLHPEVIVFDEALSALDPPVQNRILELLAKLRSSYNLSYVFISHDLTLLAKICRDVAVMYRGRVVERAPMETFIAAPAHPYSKQLVQAIPRLPPGFMN
jgi:ABC-type glutathione transport system ATPase component